MRTSLNLLLSVGGAASRSFMRDALFLLILLCGVADAFLFGRSSLVEVPSTYGFYHSAILSASQRSVALFDVFNGFLSLTVTSEVPLFADDSGFFLTRSLQVSELLQFPLEPLLTNDCVWVCTITGLAYCISPLNGSIIATLDFDESFPGEPMPGWVLAIPPSGNAFPVLINGNITRWPSPENVAVLNSFTVDDLSAFALIGNATLWLLSSSPSSSPAKIVALDLLTATAITYNISLDLPSLGFTRCTFTWNESLAIVVIDRDTYAPGLLLLSLAVPSVTSLVWLQSNISADGSIDLLECAPTAIEGELLLWFIASTVLRLRMQDLTVSVAEFPGSLGAWQSITSHGPSFALITCEPYLYAACDLLWFDALNLSSTLEPDFQMAFYYPDFEFVNSAVIGDIAAISTQMQEATDRYAVMLVNVSAPDALALAMLTLFSPAGLSHSFIQSLFFDSVTQALGVLVGPQWVDEKPSDDPTYATDSLAWLYWAYAIGYALASIFTLLVQAMRNLWVNFCSGRRQSSEFDGRSELEALLPSKAK